MGPTSTFRSALHRNFDVGQNVFLQNEPFLCWITFSFIVHDFAKLLCLFIVLISMFSRCVLCRFLWNNY